MRRFACLIIVGVAVLAMGITREQSLVSGVLQGLKFESVKAEGGLIGGPQKIKVTKATVEYLEKLLKDDCSLMIGNNGEVQVVDAKGKPVKAE